MLNWFVLIGSTLVGVAAGVVTRRVLTTSRPGTAFGAGSLTGAGGSALMLVAVALATSRDAFALVHVAYGALTIAVPVAAAIAATRWRQAGLWFRTALCCGLMLAPLGLYATHIEPFWLRIDVHTLEVDAPGADGIRIAVLSDLQTPEIGDYEDRAVEALLAEQPDLVLISGDFWQFPTAEFEVRAPQFAAVMKQIGDAVPHAFAVNGNNDSVSGLSRLTEDTGVVVLDNESVEIAIDGTAIRILGISFEGDEADLPGTIGAFLDPAGDPVVRIVLGHRPDEIDRFSPGDPIDLFVAGHTHGGQVAFPWIGPPVNLSSVPRSVGGGGLHELYGHMIYVSTGVGRERLYAPQIRFGVRPSIGILDLIAIP